jgi:hypothetical protein
MFKKSNPKNSMCSYCTAGTVVCGVLGGLALLASLMGVFMAHFGTEQGGAVFGTMSGSLSILSLVACLFFVKKMSSCCPCQCNIKK